MANSSLTLSSLDFDSLKKNFKEFLSSQSIFKDYNFEGSNINVLLDVLSYNSYLNAFYLNMVASEMFLDSAQKYDSVISHAKELNYLPHSAKSSYADISFNITTTGIENQLNIPKGTKFSGINSNGIFSFVTNEDVVITSSNNFYQVSNLSIYDGSYFSDSFVVDYNIENQQFVLSNKNIDISSLSLNVIENNGANVTTFSRVENLFGLDSNSNVYFLQASQNYYYEIIFGDGLFGRKPKNQAVILANYRVVNGPSADGIDNFTIDDDLGIINGGQAETSEIIVNVNSNSGADQETLESIRFSAPRYFATQQRAISSDDYASLVLNQFGSQISDVIVYGGQEVEPKQYGKVILSIKPSSGTIATQYIKNEISNYLAPYIAIPNRIAIVDPDYLYVYIQSEIQYNKNSTSKSKSEIEFAVLDSIKKYSLQNLEKFGNDLRYSKLLSIIDKSDSSIESNDTKLKVVKKISPLFGYPTTYKLEFNNPANFEEEIKDIGYIKSDAFSDEPVLVSSKFTYVDSSGNEYPLSFLRDDNKGNIAICTSINDVFTILNKSIGTIDYNSGYVIINNLKTSYYNNYISLYLDIKNKDVLANKNKIIIIDPNDVSITVKETIK